MIYLIMMTEFMQTKIRPNNPYWIDIITDAPPVFAYTESEGMVSAFLSERKSPYFKVMKYMGEPDDFLCQRKLNVYSILSETGDKEIVMSSIEYEQVKMLGMQIMKGHTDYMLKGISSRKKYPMVSDELLELGYGSLYEIMYLGLGNKIKPNEYNIFLDSFGWTMR